MRRQKAGLVASTRRTVWLSSMAAMAAVLSDNNRTMLRLIHELKPKSLTELAEPTGRQVLNLSPVL